MTIILSIHIDKTEKKFFSNRYPTMVKSIGLRYIRRTQEDKSGTARTSVYDIDKRGRARGESVTDNGKNIGLG